MNETALTISSESVQEIRKLLTLSTNEAAELFNIGVRTWQYYEKDQRKIPEETKKQLATMARSRIEIAGTLKELMTKTNVFFLVPSFELFQEIAQGANVIQWRFYQSITTELAIHFNKPLHSLSSVNETKNQSSIKTIIQEIRKNI